MHLWSRSWTGSYLHASLLPWMAMLQRCTMWQGRCLWIHAEHVTWVWRQGTAGHTTQHILHTTQHPNCWSIQVRSLCVLASSVVHQRYHITVMRNVGGSDHQPVSMNIKSLTATHQPHQSLLQGPPALKWRGFELCTPAMCSRQLLMAA
jgi:hypothetical protein